MDERAELEAGHWDCVIIGTGVGGASLGHALARAGQKVLFLEKGRAGFLYPDTVRGAYPETLFPREEAASPDQASVLRRGGRCSEAIGDGGRRFVPLMGTGTGGSSALYGMAMERFFPDDFKPGLAFPALARDSDLPAQWPLQYDELTRWYRQAEQLYGVRGGRDPLRPTDAPLPASPPLSARSAELHAHFEAAGLHPYRLPMACEFVTGCECCQGFLCPRDCKNDAARACLRPALDQHGAVLVDECEAVRFEATATTVSSLLCRHQGREYVVKARRFVAAAGALATPLLLLNSRSACWPDGLANRTGLVGRNLMRHFVDLYLVFTRAQGENRLKEIGLSDFYARDGRKLGTLQSFGALPPASVLAATMAQDLADVAPWAAPLFVPLRPLVKAILPHVFGRGILLAGIMEDLPYRNNRIVPGDPPRLEYSLRTQDHARLRHFRSSIADTLKPYRFLALRQAEKNAMLAHVCGTCRFGDDPQASVLDRNNRAHGIDNLYVVDASFFPSSAGTNPALTIAANALRVADVMLSSNEQGVPR